MGAVITGRNDANRSYQYFSSIIYFGIFIIAVAGALDNGVFDYAPLSMSLAYSVI